MKIVVHSGLAHADDLLAVCLLLAKYPDAKVARVANPDLSEDAVFVDVGGRYEPPRFLDHHQDSAIHSSFALVLEHHYGIPLEKLPLSYKFYDLKDRIGLKAACEELGVAPSLPSPLEIALIEVFSKRSEIAPGDPLHSVLIEIGRSVVEGLNAYLSLTERIKGRIETENGTILLVDDPTVQIQAIKEQSSGVIGVVKPNSRNPQQTDLLSIDNNPHFRPSNYLTWARTAFVHQTGFLRVIDMSLDEAWHKLKQEIGGAQQKNLVPTT